MTPFGSLSIVLNAAPGVKVPLYTCPPGCRVKVSDITFSNTNTSGSISAGLWKGNSVVMNGHPVSTVDSWQYPSKVYLNENETLYATAATAGWVICSFNYRQIDETYAVIPTDFSQYDPNGIYSDLTGKVAMTAPLVSGQRTRTGLFLGQSMINNNVTNFTPYNAGPNVAALHTNGIFYQVSGAMLGCGGNMPDNPTARFGDKIIGAGKADRVNIVNRAIGSTNPQSYTKTGYFGGIIPNLASNLRSINMQVDFVDLEWGSRAAIDQMPAQTFCDGLRDVVAYLREVGIYAPVFVFKHTRFGTYSLVGAPAVRDGCDMALSNALGIYSGADMDTIPDSERSGGGHLLATGSDSSAQKRYDHHQAFFGW